MNSATYSKSYARPLLILIPLILLATWIGIRGLDMDSLWLDEYLSVYTAGGWYEEPRTPLDVWNLLASSNPWQAPLYFMLLNVWGGIVGWTEFAARSLSLFVGLISIAATYRLGRELHSSAAGLAAAILLGTSAYFLYFFHELRAYTLYVFFTPFMVWAYWRLVKGPPKTGYYLLLGLTIIGALYTHYFAALTAVTLGLYHLLTGPSKRFKGKRQIWWRISVVFVVALIAFLPWMRVLVDGILTATDQLDVRGANAMSASNATEGLLFMFSNGSVALLLILLLLSISHKRAAIFAWFWALSVLIMLLLINAQLGVILEIRYMFAMWPPLALLAGFSIAQFAQYKRSWAYAVLGIWVISGVWVSLDRDANRSLFNPHWHLPWRQLESALEARVQREDRVAFLLPNWTWPVYHERQIRYYLHDLPVEYHLIDQPEHSGEAIYLEEAQEAVTDAARFWVASTPDQPLNHADDFQAVLQVKGFFYCGSVKTEAILELDLYAREDEASANAIQFGPSPRLSISPVAGLPSMVDELINVAWLWSLDDPAQAGLYSVALHLENTEGQLVAQSDHGVPQLQRACTVSEIAVESLPDGQYTLYLALYAWETGIRQGVLDGLDIKVSPDGRIILGQIQVSH